jgi:NAD(P)-dependent dehydrogenase (short-subunit alcohol dehydrogenase family)
MEWNLASLICPNRSAIQAFLAQRAGGSILNIGSVLATSASPRHFATHAYATAKAAIVGLTRSAASYYARCDIRFNVIAPGLVNTPMSRRATENEAIVRYVRAKQSLDGVRVGKPWDLSTAVIYFPSDQSRFVTGQVRQIDGG